MDTEEGRGTEFFDKMGLVLRHQEVEVGNTYPIFGMITAISDETPGGVVAELNHSIVVRLNLSEGEHVDLLKKRAFETGIFIAKVLSTEPRLEVECSTVIFGRSQAHYA